MECGYILKLYLTGLLNELKVGCDGKRRKSRMSNWQMDLISTELAKHWRSKLKNENYQLL
jgi:hypothetical protein